MTIQIDHWETALPTNWFSSDQQLQRTLEFYEGATSYRAGIADLYHFGRICATQLEPLSRELSHPSHAPRFERFGRTGKRVEQLYHHPTQHAIGRILHDAGLFHLHGQPARHLWSVAYLYLSAQNGEIGHHNSLMATVVVSRLLQKVGLHPAQKERTARYLHALQEKEPLSVALCLTHTQQKTVATPDPTGEEGVWRITGSQTVAWVASADLMLVAVQLHSDSAEQPSQSALFLLPRFLHDQTLNHVSVEQIEPTVGANQQLMGRIVFQNALAYQIGDSCQTDSYLSDYIYSTLHFYNAIAFTAYTRRSYVVAWSYTNQNRFDARELIRLPLVQQMLTHIRTDATALLSGSLHIAKLLDHLDNQQDDPDLPALVRTLLTLHFLRASKLAQAALHDGIELLGENGIIDSYSSLPLLSRDAAINVFWSGSPYLVWRTLFDQCQQYAAHLPFLKRTRQLLEAISVVELKQEGMAVLDQLSAELDAILALDHVEGQVYFAPVMERLADLFYVACMAVESAWDTTIKQDRTKQRLAEFLLKRRVTQLPLGHWREYPTWLARLCHEHRPTRTQWNYEAWDQFEKNDRDETD